MRSLVPKVDLGDHVIHHPNPGEPKSLQGHKPFSIWLRRLRHKPASKQWWDPVSADKDQGHADFGRLLTSGS